jgi:hypothetical protein
MRDAAPPLGAAFAFAHISCIDARRFKGDDGMTPDERQMISGLFDRVRAAEGAPRDRDAEAYISGRAKEAPNAAYTLAQVVLVQEQALGAAQRRIEELEAQLRDAQSAPPAQQGGGFLSSIFGGSTPPPAAPPPVGAWGRGAPSGDPRQGYGAPPPAGPWGGAPQQGFGGAPQGWGGAPQPARGGGFLSGALSTAAGVAGGMMLANSIQGLFKSDPHLASTAGQSHAAADLQGLGSDASSIWPSTPAAPSQNDGYGYQNAADDGGYDDGGDYDDGSSDV